MRQVTKWEYLETTDPMDDLVLRIGLVQACVPETDSDERKVVENLEPAFACRVRINEHSLRCEAFICFSKKAFSIQEPRITAIRYRIDKHPSVTCSAAITDGGVAGLLRGVSFVELYTAMENATQLICQVPILTYGTHNIKFDISGFKAIREKMTAGVMKADFPQLRQFNSGLVDSLMVCGPKNVHLLVDTLVELGFLNPSQVEAARAKWLDFFIASQKFAEKYGVSEINGHIRSRSPLEINESFMTAIRKQSPHAVQLEWGELGISD